MLMLPVYLVDDDESVLDSLAFLLEELGYVTACFSSGPDFLAQAILEKPGCVVLDSRMPLMRGQYVHQQLKLQNSPLGIVYLTGHGDVPMAVEALHQGAVDFLQKPVDSEKLSLAIDKAHQYSVQAEARAKVQYAYESLTEREKDILSRVVKGAKNQVIADDLCIAVRTVEVHRSNLMKKFATKSIAELGMYYSQIFF